MKLANLGIKEVTVAYKYQGVKRRNSRIKVRNGLKVEMEKSMLSMMELLSMQRNTRKNHLPGEDYYRCSKENEKVLAGKCSNRIPSLTRRLFRYSLLLLQKAKRFIPNKKKTLP